MIVRILNNNAVLPTRSNINNGKFLYSSSLENIIIKPFEFALIPIGITIFFPGKIYGKINTIDNNLEIANDILLSNNYEELKLILTNCSDKTYIIKHKDIVGVIHKIKYENCYLEILEELTGDNNLKNEKYYEEVEEVCGR